MPDIGAILSGDLAALAIGLFVVTGLRLAFGVFAALRDNTFVLSSVAAFLRSQVVGRVFPILATAVAALSVDGPSGVALTTAAAAGGAAYLAESVGAIVEALSASAQQQAAEKTAVAVELGNPVPQD